MVDCITDEGVCDKFIGDAMMCFRHSVPHDDDPDRAVRAAIRMMTDLKVFNDKRSTEGKMPIDHGMESIPILLFQVLVRLREWTTPLLVMELI